MPDLTLLVDGEIRAEERELANEYLEQLVEDAEAFLESYCE